MLLVGCFLALAAHAEEKTYAYLWSPRTTDVGAPGSPDNTELKTVLELCPTVTYSPTSPEGFDFIIRKTFLVSHKSATHAYTLYLNRLHELNPGKFSNDIVNKGETIVLPSGPKYGGSELQLSTLSPEVQDYSFNDMSKAAYQVGHDVPERIKMFAVNTLRYYISPSGEGSVDDIFKEIQQRGLVYAINAKSSLDKVLAQTQTISLKVTDDASKQRMDSLTQLAPTKVMPGMFAVSVSQPVTCPGPCTDCRTAMNIPATVDFSKVKVLIIDTDISPGMGCRHKHN